MRSEIRNILIFITVLAILFAPYYTIRSASVEKQFVEGVAARSAVIKPAADSFNRSESPDPEKIKLVFNEISSVDRSFAAIALTDRFDGLKYLVKNDSILKSGAAVDGLIKDIKERKISDPENSMPAMRYYSDGGSGRDKYYIVKYASSGQKTYAVYSFKPARKVITRLALEALLLVSISFALTGAILSIMRKKGIGGDIKVRTIVIGAKSENKIHDGSAKKQPRAEQIDQNELTPIIGSETSARGGDMARKSNPSAGSASDSLNAVIFDFFREIHSRLRPESISLYIKKMEGRLSKSYELKEKTFLRIDSSLFENIRISEIEGSGKSGTQVIEDGKVIRIPLYDDRSLLGLIEIRLKDSSERLDLGSIQAGTSKIANGIKDYLVINSVIIDRETGFFSSSYFNMKLSEQIFSAQKINTVFTLLLIDIFSSLDLDGEQKNTVLKIIYPVVRKSAGEVNELFIRGDKIAMIFTEKEIREIEGIELAVSKEISRFRIKLSAENIIKLKPVAVIMRSTEAADVKNILSEAQSLFDPES